MDQEMFKRLNEFPLRQKIVFSFKFVSWKLLACHGKWNVKRINMFQTLPTILSVIVQEVKKLGEVLKSKFSFILKDEYL